MEPTLHAYTTNKTGSRFQFSPKQLRIFAIVGVFIVTALSLWFYINTYLYKTKAGTEDVVVQFTPAKDRYQPGEEFMLPVRLTADASKVISGADLVVLFDENQDKVEYVPQELDKISTDFNDLIYQEVSQVGTSKQVRITLTSSNKATLKNLTLINLKFKAKTTTGQTTFKLDATRSQVPGTAAAYIFNLLTEDKTIGIGQDPVVTPTVTITGVQPTIPPVTNPTPGPHLGTTLYSPVYTNNTGWAVGAEKQFTNVYITNPQDTDASVVITVYDKTGAELKKINATVGKKGWWSSVGNAEWNSLPTGTQGWTKITSDKAIMATNKQTLHSGATFESSVLDYDDELFTTKLSTSAYSPMYIRKIGWGANLNQGKQYSQFVVVNPSETEAAQVTINVYKGDDRGASTFTGKVTTTIPARGLWNSYDSPEWPGIGGNENPESGSVEVISNIGVIAVNRATLRETEDFKSRIIHFDDELLSTTETNSVGTKLYAPLYAARQPFGSNQGAQSSQLVVGNAGTTATTIQVKVYRANSVGAVSAYTFERTLQPKGIWNSFVDNYWNNDLAANPGVGWVEVTSTNPIFAVNRVTLRKDNFNSELYDFNDQVLSTKVSTAMYGSVYEKRYTWGANQGKQFSTPIIMNPNTKDLNLFIRVYNGASSGVQGNALAEMPLTIKAGQIWMGDSAWNSLAAAQTGRGWYEVISASTMPFMAINRLTVQANDDPTSRILFFDEEMMIPVGADGTIDNSNPFPVITPGPGQGSPVPTTIVVDPSGGPSPIACSATIACPANYQCISNTCRPMYCQSTSISNQLVDTGKSSTITSTANNNQIRTFTYAFYNLDNLDPQSNTPKPIHFEDGKHYTKAVNPASPTNSATTTVTSEEFNKPDKNNGGAIPKRIQVNAYFTGPGGFSAPAAACVVNFHTAKPDVEIKMKLKFQGIVRKVAPEYSKMRVKVSLVGGTLTQPNTSYGEFTQISDEIWEGTVGFFGNFPQTGSNYAVLVKGPKHLQRKICAITAKDDENGFYTCTNNARSITLKNGENIVDFSNIIQPAGDLPMNGNQDGVIDSLDLVYLRSRLGTKNAADFIVGDLNLDGIIDSQDHSLPVKVLDLNKNTDDE